MGVYNILGAAAAKVIDLGIRVLGRRIRPDDYLWLKCPVGLPEAVGTQMYNDIAAAENLEQCGSATAGLLASFAVLNSDDFDSSRVDPRIRDFYERTAAYELEAVEPGRRTGASVALGPGYAGKPPHGPTGLPALAAGTLWGHEQ
jgi:hypothetical protein